MIKQEKKEASQRELRLKKELKSMTQSRNDLRKGIDECERPLRTTINRLEIRNQERIRERFEILKTLDEAGFPALHDTVPEAVQKLADAYKKYKEKREVGQDEK